MENSVAAELFNKIANTVTSATKDIESAILCNSTFIGAALQDCAGQRTDNSKLQAQATVLAAIITKTDMEYVKRLASTHQKECYSAMCTLAVAFVEGLIESDATVQEKLNETLIKEN